MLRAHPPSRADAENKRSCITLHPTLTSGMSFRGEYKVNYTKEFLCITHTVEHNYISFSSSTVGIQLHVSALYVGHLQVAI